MANAGQDIRFEISHGKKEWRILPDQCQTKINDTIATGDSTILVEYDAQNVTVDLGKMSVTYPSGDAKYLRCSVADPSGDFYVWSHKSDNNFWKSYQPHDSRLLEKAFDDGEHQTKIQIGGLEYIVHFRKWHQESVETGYRRKVSRIASDGTAITVKTENQEPVKEEANDVISTSRSKSKSKSAASSGTTKSMQTTLKGRPPVDPDAVGVLGNVKAHVYADDSSGDIYDVLLNQTNVAQNNNKYYIIQLIEADGKQQYWSWTRWGRVGYRGQHSLEACGSDLNKALNLFKKKFQAKTNNAFEDRKSFVKYSGKYDLIERDYGGSNDEESVTSTDLENVAAGAVKRKASSDADEPKKKKAAEESKVDSKLDIRLQQILEMICDIREMEEIVVSMNYDVQKAPLGKLTETQLKAGYAALKKIADIIEQRDSESTRQVSSSRKAPTKSLGAGPRQSLIEACNEFYTRVPHFFGMRQPPLISTHSELKSKLELLETLGDIEIAIHSMKEEQSLLTPEHPLDKHYRNLHCAMSPVEKSSDDFALIKRYMHDTHGMTHNTYKMELLEAFEVNRDVEVAGFRQDIGNNVLLWHGSRLTNYYGILNQGLRIAPPEAPVTGYMFGKGVYFADCASKSANYCQTSSLRDVGFLLLCKVALGKPRELTAADCKADKLPKGFNSIKGLGKFIPDSKTFVTQSDGTLVPAGRLIPNTDPNSSRFALMYNEFVVYDTQQIAMKYICKVKFSYSI